MLANKKGHSWDSELKNPMLFGMYIKKTVSRKTENCNVLKRAVPLVSHDIKQQKNYDGQNRPENKIWGQLDSNQRSRETRDLQSLAIAAMRYPQMRKNEMLTVGLEPTTIRLQIGSSTS
jgi:hypothetical protein